MIQHIPNLFIAGTAKCGTTALAHALAAHPDIAMPGAPPWRGVPKEPAFFSSKHYTEDRLAWAAEHKAYPENVRYRLDATPTYLHTPGALERIQEHCPEFTCIYMLREPVARAVSRFNHFLHLEQTRPGFNDHWGLDASLSFAENVQLEMDGKAKNGGALLRPGRYWEHLQHWPAGIEIFMEHLKESGQFKLDCIQHWLGLPNHKIVPPVTNIKPRMFEPEQDTLDMLKEYFAPFNRELRENIGELPEEWGI